jgi:PAS domain-containing protein
MLDLVSPGQPGRPGPRAVLVLLRGHAVPLSAFAVALLLSFLLWPLSPRLPLAVFLGAVLVSAWRSGARAGLLTTALSAAALLGLHWLWPVAGPGDEDYLPRLVLFTLAGLLASFLSHQCQRAVRASQQVETVLASIGTALVFADRQGRLTFLNGLAESLTGWKQADARTQPLDAVFALVHQDTRQPLTLPVAEVLRTGTPLDLAENALLVSLTGAEAPIDGTVTLIRAARDRVAGVAVTFWNAAGRRQTDRDLWQRSQDALRESEQRAEAALRARDDLRRQLQESSARVAQAEEALRAAQQALQKQTAERERLEQQLETVRADFARKLEERTAAQQRAEEAARKIRENLGRQLAEQTAARQRIEEAARAGQEDWQRQLGERTAAQLRAEEALRKANEDLQRQVEESARLQRRVEEMLRLGQKDLQRQLQEETAARQQAEEALRQARDELERHRAESGAAEQLVEEETRRLREERARELAERDAARRHAEEALEQARADFGRQLAERAAELEQVQDSLRAAQEELARQRHAEETLRQAREELERQLSERTDELARVRGELQALLTQRAQDSLARNGQHGVFANGQAAPAPADHGDWLSFN